jgi:hypothetical protein
MSFGFIAPGVADATPRVRLHLPTDKHLHGFCKGAVRLQAGLDRKAFGVQNRAHGSSGISSYWCCEKCNFEGPLYNIVNTSDEKKRKKEKPERIFDPKIRVSQSGMIRYRWAFLARCHVPVKDIVPQNTEAGKDGSFGSFGCIFCCAEGKARGWLDQSDNSSMSVRSGHSAKKSDGSSGSYATPVFGEVNAFMAHLERMHSKKDGRPNAEMLGRMKVILEKVANAEDLEWDVNFVTG